MTSTSLAASLSAPRIPPVGTAQRTMLHGGDPSMLPWVKLPMIRTHSQHKELEEESQHHPDVLVIMQQRLRDRLVMAHKLRGRRFVHLPHPHLADTTDRVTRVLGGVLPIPWQHSFRDSGAFRCLCDGLVTALVAPGMVLSSSPTTMVKYVRLSKRAIRVRYGNHAMQVMDVLLPSSSSPPNEGMKTKRRRMVVFVHGGAWGRYANRNPNLVDDSAQL